MSRVAQLPQAIAGHPSSMVRADLRDIAGRWAAELRAGRIRATLLWRAFPAGAILRAEERAVLEMNRGGEDCYRRGSYKSGGHVCIGLRVRALSRLAVSIFSRAIERAGENLACERFLYARDLFWG